MLEIRELNSSRAVENRDALARVGHSCCQRQQPMRPQQTSRVIFRLQLLSSWPLPLCMRCPFEALLSPCSLQIRPFLLLLFLLCYLCRPLDRCRADSQRPIPCALLELGSSLVYSVVHTSAPCSLPSQGALRYSDLFLCWREALKQSWTGLGRRLYCRR